MIEILTSYFMFILSFLFCFVLSKLEQRKRNSKILGSAVFYSLLFGFYKRIETDANAIAVYFDVHHIIAAGCIVVIFSIFLYLAKEAFLKFFQNETFN